MKKNMLNKLLKNKIVYYVVLALTALNVLGYFSMRSWECIVLFSAVAYSANCYCGNMTVSLLAGLFVSNFVFGCNRVKEGFKEARAPVKKANKLLKKAEKKALREGHKASNALENMECTGEDCGNEGFAIREGNQNKKKMDGAASMLKALTDGEKGTQNAEALERVINNMGGVSGILQAFGSMNTA
tara:strand:- start:2167 stop:2724 length:558 start_codon:yes stop_codon:yes gene_type:complete